MKLTTHQSIYPNWIAAQEQEDEILAMHKANPLITMKELLAAFPATNHRSMLECLRQNEIALAPGRRPGSGKHERAAYFQRKIEAKIQAKLDEEFCGDYEL